jgi:uncharacterized protein (DUF305 family)
MFATARERRKGRLATMKLQRLGRALVVGVLVTTVAAALNACGDDADEGSAGNAGANGAFLEAMIPHHESAIEMATIARRRAEHPEVRELAQDIVRTQRREIRQIERIHQRLFGQKILPNSDAHQGLGLSAEEAGMAHMEPTGALAEARPFDRAFIDEMVPHHQGAIRMARAVLDETEDGGTRSLAEAILRTQSDEIEQMNEWRHAWYGDASPAGGVPAGEVAPSEMDSTGEHDGH